MRREELYSDEAFGEAMQALTGTSVIATSVSEEPVDPERDGPDDEWTPVLELWLKGGGRVVFGLDETGSRDGKCCMWARYDPKVEPEELQ